MSVPLPMTFMSFDMDRPLNKAHRHERTAAAKLREGNWDEAEKSYSLAAEMMKKALEEVSSTTVAAPIEMQVTELEKMKDVIDIKRQEASQKKSPQTESPKSQNASPKLIGIPKKADNGHKTDHKEKHENTRDKSTETSHIKETRKTFYRNSSPNTWQIVPKDLIQMVQERENDSLLQFLHLPIDAEQDPLSSSMRKKPKSQEAIAEEYKTRFSLLQTTAVALIKALDDSEKENSCLKKQVEELSSEVAVLTERLEIYENQAYTPVHFDDEDISTTPGHLPGEFSGNVMTASMLIDQPESYFEFDGKDLESELRDATKDHKQLDQIHKPRPICEKGNAGRKPSPSSDLSVQYEDLDEGLNTEVSETLSNCDASSDLAGSPQLRMTSLAGLPPLSPVHFDLE